MTFFLFFGAFYGIYRIFEWHRIQNTPSSNENPQHLAFVERVMDRDFGKSTRVKLQDKILNPLATESSHSDEAVIAENGPPEMREMPPGDPPPYAGNVNESQQRLRVNTIKDFEVYRSEAVRDPYSEENLTIRESLVDMRTARLDREKASQDSL